MSQSPLNFQHLSVSERLQLVEDIWDSIAAEDPAAAALTPAQLHELQVRLDAHAADPSSALPWEKVRAELLQH